MEAEITKKPKVIKKNTTGKNYSVSQENFTSNFFLIIKKQIIGMYTIKE